MPAATAATLDDKSVPAQACQNLGRRIGDALIAHGGTDLSVTRQHHC